MGSKSNCYSINKIFSKSTTLEMLSMKNVVILKEVYIVSKLKYCVLKKGPDGPGTLT